MTAQPGSWPLLSVVIPTYGREAPLHDTIKDVLTQDYPNVEVLVIDQCPKHSAELQTFLDTLAQNGQIQYFSLPWASLPGARNYAARRAQGEVLLFLDDDVLLPPGFFAAHMQVFQERPEVGAVAGRAFDRMKLADAKRESCIEERVVEDLPPEAMDPGIAWYHLDLVHTVKAQTVLTARGCNMAFRRSIFAQHGIYFDERFRGSAVREESDFCLRLRQTGYQIWYEPAAHLVHLGEETGGCHDVSTRSIQYQITFYHNHFLMGLKNLTFWQCLRFFAKFFDCHVLGHPPCYKSGSPLKVLSRGIFYVIAFVNAVWTLTRSLWNDGQIYSQMDGVGNQH
jgi:GT2 family glycosyltransferase